MDSKIVDSFSMNVDYNPLGYEPISDFMNKVKKEIERIEAEQERALIKSLKDKTLLVSDPLIKAQLEEDYRFKNTTIIYSPYVAPGNMFLINRVALY